MVFSTNPDFDPVEVKKVQTDDFNWNTIDFQPTVFWRPATMSHAMDHLGELSV
jgi:hypothetical protein